MLCFQVEYLMRLLQCQFLYTHTTSEACRGFDLYWPSLITLEYELNSLVDLVQ